jgi:hypothetical protein
MRSGARATPERLGDQPIVPMTTVGRRYRAIGPGANAQRRRKGDTHVLNALRTVRSAPPPERRSPLTPSKLDAHSQTRLFRDAAKKRRRRSRGSLEPAKKRRWDTALRPFRDLAFEPGHARDLPAASRATCVTPPKAGVQFSLRLRRELDTGFRRYDEKFLAAATHSIPPPRGEVRRRSLRRWGGG